MKIKSILSFIFCILLSLFTAKAQSAHSPWNIGIHITGNAGKMLWAGEDVNNPNFSLTYPETVFRLGYGFGTSISYSVTNRFYIPGSFDIINRKFAIATGGVATALDENFQFIAIDADHIDYKITQASLALGIGFKLFEKIVIEVLPYYQVAITDQKIKIGKVIDWRKSDFFQQSQDYGISGNLKFIVNSFYLKLGYQYGLKAIEEYCAFDANALPLGKYQIKNTMGLVSLGYTL
ncbi:MAG TPA: hypothetical protein PKD18_02445 [Saprospiraceae bacterium]|nr:hypothetical protein [Saprospiraceae bacterium]